MVKQIIFLLLSLILSSVVGFAPIKHNTNYDHVVHDPYSSSVTALFAGSEGDSGGGAAIAKPQIKTSQKVETVQKEKVKQRQKAKIHDPISRREEEFEEAPMFKLMLLGDESYDPIHVTERLCAIVDDFDEDQAMTVLQQANQSGEAMCGKYPFEKAELFKEQLIRSNPMIFSDIKEENK